MKILVSGANGQLGKCIHDVAGEFPGVEFIFLGREHFALERFDRVRQVLETIRPQWVINAAAYTAVDRAENESAMAFLINGEAVGHLAQACAAVGSRLVHVSTDYVFDGSASKPYREDDPVNPLGVYGASKLQGETLALQHAPESIIVRTSWVYSQHGHNFVKAMLRLMKEKERIGVVNDQLGCPTYAIDLARALVTIACHAQPRAGIYHYSNSGPISWYDFASAIGSLTQSACKVEPIPTSAYPTPARRPAWSVLDNTRIQQVFGIPQLPWKDRLQACLQALGY